MCSFKANFGNVSSIKYTNKQNHINKSGTPVLGEIGIFQYGVLLLASMFTV